jgi:prophage regulatory protein
MTQLIRRPETQSRTGLTTSRLYELMAKGEFPRPVRIGTRAVAWNVEEVDRWIADRLAARETSVS